MPKQFKNMDYEECKLDEKQKMNDAMMNYQFSPLYSRGNGCESLTNFTTDNYMMSQQTVGNADTCAINQSNRMRVGENTKPQGPQTLQTRVFHGVPDLSRGKPNVDVESRMRHGDFGNANRSCIEDEERVNQRWQEPALDCWHNRFMNEGMMPQMTRGGVNTREMMKEGCGSTIPFQNLQ